MSSNLTHLEGRAGEARGPELTLAAGAGLAVLAVVLTGWKLPAMILPIASTVLLIAGFALAAACWSAGARDSRHLTYRDVAGLLVFLGFGSAMLIDPAALGSLVGPPAR
jgi:hypothetical protein